MKELYLIPKHIYDIMQTDKSQTDIKTKKKHNNRLNERWGTTVLPPPLQNKVHLNPIKIPDTRKSNNRQHHYKPTIYDQLNLRFKPENLHLANLILKYFEKSSSTLWDEYGDLFSPISGYNIIDIIHDFIFDTDIKDPLKIDSYRFLVSSTNLPLHYIRNNSLKNNLTKVSHQQQGQDIRSRPITRQASKSKKKVGGSIKLSRPSSSWTCY